MASVKITNPLDSPPAAPERVEDDEMSRIAASIESERSAGGRRESAGALGVKSPRAGDGEPTLLQAYWCNFMGHSPIWYKQMMLCFFVLNVVVRLSWSKQATAWAVLLEFICTLALSTYCYPLQPGGGLVIQAYAMGLATSERLTHEVEANINVLLLVAFMVACIHFLKNLLLMIFTQLLVKLESKVLLAVSMMLVSAVLSAFLDALSVAAVIVSVCTGVLGVYYSAVEQADLPMLETLHHETMAFELVPHAPDTYEDIKAHGVGETHKLTEEEVTAIFEDGAQANIPRIKVTQHAPGQDSMQMVTMDMGRPQTPVLPPEEVGAHDEDVAQLRRFLRGLLMHSAVGTIVGGCMSMVGQPQNLVIARHLGWEFDSYFVQMLPISVFVFPLGLLTCVAVESAGVCGYGDQMPAHVRKVLNDFVDKEYSKIHNSELAELQVQAVAGVVLCLGLAFHVTEVGFVGLAIAVLVTLFNGISEEAEIAHAFLEAMPFVSLLVVFFAIVAVIQEQGIFGPIIDYVLSMDEGVQPTALFVANGVLSMVSDNVFVATIFIDTVANAYKEGANNMTRAHFEKLAVATSMGTNLPSCATPNGQAAFLFILTSGISPLVQLSYAKMVTMTLPYTVTLTIAGLLGITLLL